MASTELHISSLFNVAHKNVLITGGGRGIGYMIADGFVRNGANVYICSRNAQALKEATEHLQQVATTSGGSIHSFVVDLSSVEEVTKVPSILQEKFGIKELHILINNSGVAWGEPLEQFSEKGWDRVMNVNLKCLFFLIKALLPLLRAPAVAKNPSRIINVGSVAGILHQSFPTYSYDVSKAGVHHLTRKLAYDLSESNITVNAIAPGFVPSKMSKSLKISEKDLQQSIPLGRVGKSSDMVGISLLLSSSAGSWITGAIIPVDGGQLTISRL